MSIVKIETFIVEQKLRQPFYFSQWKYDTRQVCLVKITDQDGRYGWGEGYGPAGVVEAGIRFFEPLVLGQNPLHIETIWQSNKVIRARPDHVPCHRTNQQPSRGHKKTE